MIVAFLIAAMADLTICLLAAIAVLIVRDGGARDGRHYENTVEMVAGDYWPHALNDDLAALLADSELDMQAVDA